jgi:hypothetical protein
MALDWQKKRGLGLLLTFHYLDHGTCGFSNDCRTLATAPISVLRLQDDASTEETFNGNETELDRLENGWKLLSNGKAFDSSGVSRLATPEDIFGFVGHFPLIFESLRTAFTGQLSTPGYLACACTTLLTSIAHSKMTMDSPRDFRAPRLAEYRTVYEFSALYLIPFAWLIWRITDAFPHELEVADPVMSLSLSAITLYGFAYAFYGKKMLDDVNNKAGYEGNLQPSSPEYQAQAQLYLTGNIVINGLACLFIPFSWTLTFRGTEWWERMQSLHPNQAAFIGLRYVASDIQSNVCLMQLILVILIVPFQVYLSLRLVIFLVTFFSV